MKTYFGLQKDSDIILSGIYPIVIENTIASISHNKINGSGAIAANYNAKITVNDLHRNNTNYLVKAIKNSWISYNDTSFNASVTNFYTDYNAIINFPKLNFSYNMDYRTGGIVSFNKSAIAEYDNRPHKFSDFQQNSAKWSTHLINGNINTGMQWQENGKNSFFYKDGTFDWHIVSAYTPNIETQYGYEIITSPDTIDKFLPDFCGHNINIRIQNVSQNANVNITNINGTLTLQPLDITFNEVTHKFTFINVDKCISNNINFNELSLKGTKYELISGKFNDIDAYSSYLKFNISVDKNIFNNFYSSYINVPKFVTSISNNINDNNYNINFLVRNTDNINLINSQLIYFSNNNNYTINNAIKYSLIRHSHSKIFVTNANDSANTGIVLNTDENNLTISPTHTSINGNYDVTYNYGLKRETLLSLPLGTIVGWYQQNINGKWYPNVPYGFKELLSTPQKFYVDVDEPSSNSYNGDFMHLFSNESNTDVWEKGYIILPAGKIITIGNIRIINIIKYNNNVTLRID